MAVDSKQCGPRVDEINKMGIRLICSCVRGHLSTKTVLDLLNAWLLPLEIEGPSELLDVRFKPTAESTAMVARE